MSDDDQNSLQLVPLPGSERPPAPDVQVVAPRLAEDRPVEATVVLRRRAALPTEPGPIDPAGFADRYGADPDDLDAVTRRLSELGLAILGSDAASRRIRISGPAATVGRVFGVDLALGRPATPAARADSDVAGERRVRTGAISIPADLDGMITAVLGLDNRPQARAQFLIAVPQAAVTGYTPLQLGQVYDFPADTDGTGQTIAIIELGGGYQQADLDTYFADLGLIAPQVSAVGVDGASNQPGSDPNGADGEVMLDIEVAGALAPGADIVIYFAPNTDDGFLDAVATATHADPTPVAVSISWGQAENQWTAQARTAMDDAFADAVALGVTVTVAAGDDGSSDRLADGRPHVDFPAASPNVLSCGGTRLTADASTGAVSAEVVWNHGSGQGATGGGYSAYFARPAYQSVLPAGSGTTAAGGGRGVPDVAADADPQTGYQVLVDGKQLVIGGTSAVAPLWAALTARLAQLHGGSFGLLQSRLYAGARAGAPTPGFRDITNGNNGAYRAGPGWDPCTGLGVPIGNDLATLFGSGSL